MSENPMSEPNSISSSVDVAVDPATAFKVFTEEVNCWWLQGPINFHDSTRAYEMLIEPRLGGRVLEVYDLDTYDGLKLAIITQWEPGAHWLQDVFGFSPASHIPDEFTDHTWIEFHIGNASLILFARPGEAEGVTHIPWVFVDD
jgi:hypothetical protein